MDQTKGQRRNRRRKRHYPCPGRSLTDDDVRRITRYFAFYLLKLPKPDIAENIQEYVQEAWLEFLKRYRAGQSPQWSVHWAVKEAARKTLASNARRYMTMRSSHRDQDLFVFDTPDSITPFDDETFDFVDPRPSPHRQVELQQTITDVYKIASGNGKRMIDLYLQGYTMREIGEKLGVTESAVSNHFRALGKRYQRRYRR